MKPTKKQSLLLRLLAARGGVLSSIGFQKSLFFLTRREMERGDKPSFDFLPLLRGGYSFTADMEREVLVEGGFLEDSPRREWRLSPYVSLPPVDRRTLMLVDDLARELEGCDDDALLVRMFMECPEMAVRSQIAGKMLQDHPEALARIEACKPKWDVDEPLFAIGYEGLSIEEFFGRLLRQGVTTLCDVRRTPFSLKKGFSKERLSYLARAVGMTYLPCPELGIASHRRRSLERQQDYDELFEEYEREDLPGMTPTLERLARRIERGERLALMCFEVLPWQCHRTILARHLSEMIGRPCRDLAGDALQLRQRCLEF